tara:strand:+ start:132 stop:722 length:591 start_codon:yes stop_codon:yes gene_type:complete
MAQKKLYVPMSAEEVAELDAMIEVVKAMPVIAELGIVVSRSTVARMALIRGMRSLAAGEESGGTGAKEGNAAKEPEPAEKPEKQPKVPGTVDDEDLPGVKYELDAEGKIKPPEGWERWSPSEHFDGSQSEVHAYYEAHGWERWWGSAGRERIVFYWNRDPNADALVPWPEASPNNKTVMVQSTPWGEGHLIPHGWV